MAHQVTKCLQTLGWLMAICTFLPQLSIASESDPDVCANCDEANLCLAAEILLSCYTNRTRCVATPEINECQFNVWKWWCSACDDSCFFDISCMNSFPGEIKWSSSATDYWAKRSCTTPFSDSCPLVLQAKSASELSAMSSTDNVSQIQNRTSSSSESEAEKAKKKLILTPTVIGVISGCGLAAIAIVFRFTRCWRRRRKVIKVSSEKNEIRLRNIEMKSRVAAQNEALGAYPKRPLSVHDLDNHAQRVSSQLQSTRGSHASVASLPPAQAFPYQHPPSMASMYASRTSLGSYPDSGPAPFVPPPPQTSVAVPLSSMYRSAPHLGPYPHTHSPYAHGQMVAQPTPPAMFPQMYHHAGPPALASQYATNRSGGSVPFQPYHYY